MKHLLLRLIAAVHYPSRVRLHLANVRLTEQRCEKARHLIKTLMASPAAAQHREQLRTMLMLVCANESVAISNRVLLENHLALYEAVGIKYDPRELNLDEVNASFERAMQSLTMEGIR